MDKRNGLIWGWKEEELEKLLWCSEAVWTVSVNSNLEREKKKQSKEQNEHTKANMPLC